MKRYLLLFLAIMIATVSRAASGEIFTFEGLKYRVLEDERSVQVAENGFLSGDINIPEFVIHNGSRYAVTSIGMDAFLNCRGLTSVTIPNSVTEINTLAFHYCSGLTSITIPKSVTEIGGGAFGACKGLISIMVDSANSNYTSKNGALFSKDMATLINFPTGVGGTYTIPESVTKIDNCAFYGCRSLTSVTIPNSVTQIGGCAFYDCESLTSVSIPNSVTSSIGDGTFMGCTSLTSVTIPDSVTSIGDDAFHACSGLTSISIPSSVTSIGLRAFVYCIGLPSVSIPDSVTEIGMWAFSSCHGLTSVTIPNSVTQIGDEAFSYCHSLTSVYYPTNEPIAANDNIFSDYTKLTLYVPEEAIYKFWTTAPWYRFSKIEAFEFSGIDEVQAEFNNEAPFEVYSLNGVMLGNSPDNLAPGIYIIRQGDRLNKIAVR